MIYSITFLLAYTALVPHYFIRADIKAEYPAIAAIMKYVPFFIVAGMLFSHIKKDRITSFYQDYRFLISLFLGYFFIACMSVLVSDNPIKSFSKVVYYSGTGFVLCVLVYNSISSQRDVYFLVKSMMVLAAILSLHGIIIRIFAFDPLMLAAFTEFDITHQTHHNLKPLGNPIRTYGTLGNSIPYGTLLMILAPFFYYDLKLHKSKLSSFVRIFCVFIISYAILSSGSRGVYIGCLLMLIVAALRSAFSCQTNKFAWSAFLKKGVLLGIFVAVSLLVGDGGNSTILSRAVTRLQQLTDSANASVAVLTSVTARLDRYTEVHGILKEKPLLGLGFGRVADRLPEYLVEERQTVAGAMTTENQLLMVAAETGLTGWIFFIAMLSAIGWHLLRLSNNFLHLHKELATACAVSFLGLMLTMLTWYALNNPAVRMYFWIIVAIGLRIRTL